VADRVVKQIGATEDLVHKLKVHAVTNKKELNDIFDEAILEFFEEREEVKKKEHRAPDYIASPTDSKDFNVRISKPLATKLEKVAKEDRATGRRLIYTGLLQYARRHKLL
jgi:hypothetical protein